MVHLAVELDVHLHAGSIVEADGGDLFTTSILLRPDGPASGATGR